MGFHDQAGATDKGELSDSELNAMALTLWHFGGARPIRWRMRAALAGRAAARGGAGNLDVGELRARTRFQVAAARRRCPGYLPAGNRPLGRIFAPGADIPPRWWELFRSRHLNDLIEMGIAHNTDLQAAEAAVRVAQANALAQRGALFPQVAANWNSSRQQTPVATLQSNAANDAEIYSLHTAQVTVSYALDVWGGTRRQIESLEALAEAQAFQREGVYLTLTANIALAAIQEASLRGQIAATRRLISLQTRLLEILRRQNSLGQIALPDVLVQETAAAQARMLLPPLERQLEQQRHLLATLTGRFPSEATAATFQLGSFRLPRQLPLSLPADLVCQRPDVRAAEANVHAANAQIGVAIANRLPQITLSGNDGSTALAISQAVLARHQRLDDRRQCAAAGVRWRHAQVQAAGRARRPGCSRWRNTAAPCWLPSRTWPICCVRCRPTPARLNAAVAAEQAAQRSFDLVRRQLEQGQVSLPILLSAQQAYLQTSLARVQAEAARLADTVALVPGAGRRLVEQVGSYDHASRLGTAMKKRLSRVPAGSMGRAAGEIGRWRSCALVETLGGALLLALLQVGGVVWLAAQASAQPQPKNADTVQVTADQMHQLEIVKVELCSFRLFKPAIGQIAFNEDASTVVLTPFSGRVTRLIAKIGDDVKRGDPLFEIDSPEVVQTQTDLIAAVQALEKSRHQLALAKRVSDRQTGLLRPTRPPRSASSTRRAPTMPRPRRTCGPPRAR